MADPIDELVLRWKQDPSPTATIALCDALRGSARARLVQQVGEFSTQRHANDIGVMLAVARMYIDAQRLAEAQAVLVGAGKIAPREADVYRWLGEVLLRRGDAERAEKVLERSMQLGTREPNAPVWLERARMFRPMQAKAGTRAVAAEVANAAAAALVANAPPPPRASMDSYSDTTTMVRELPPGLRQESRHDNGALRRAESAGSIVAANVEIKRVEIARDEEDDLATTAVHETTRSPSAPAMKPLARPRSFPQDADTAPAFKPITPPPPPPTLQRPDSVDVEFSVQAPIPEEPVPRQPPPQRPPTPAPAASRPSPPLQRNDLTVGDDQNPFAVTNPFGTEPAPAPRTHARARSPEDDRAMTGSHLAPHARDVLDALAIAGVFEPEGAIASVALKWDRAQKQPRRVWSGILISFATLLFVGGGVGAFFYVRDRRAKEHQEAESQLTDIEAQLRASRASSLDKVEEQLSHVFDLESRSPRASLEWLHERAMVGLLKKGADVSFETGLVRAKEVEIPEDKTAFARVASFLFQGDTIGAASILPTWDGRAGKDAWYQLLAGATLERAGDGRARERYQAAVELDAELVAAQVALARSVAIDGDPKKAKELADDFRKKYPDRVEGAALVALAWARDPDHADAPPAELEEAVKGAAELPLSLAFVPHAVSALKVPLDAEQARANLSDAIASASEPGIAAWLGSIALNIGDEPMARKAAVKAISLSSAYGPARLLAARVSLTADRLDEAFKATEELDPASPDVAVIRAATSYERMDADGVERALAALTPEAKKASFLASLALAPRALSGNAQLTGAKLLDLSDDKWPWSDLLAMDAALDLGDLDVAAKIAGAWKGREDPLHVLRLARLARYQGRLDDAEALIQSALGKGTVTKRVVIERAFILTARGKSGEIGALLSRHAVVLGDLLSGWLSAYATASTGKPEDAKAKALSLDVLPERAPLVARLVIAAAYGAMKDRKHGAEYVQRLLQTGMHSPDLVAAALALGFTKNDKGGFEAPPPEKP